MLRNVKPVCKVILRGNRTVIPIECYLMSLSDHSRPVHKDKGMIPLCHHRRSIHVVSIVLKHAVGVERRWNIERIVDVDHDGIAYGCFNRRDTKRSRHSSCLSQNDVANSSLL